MKKTIVSLVLAAVLGLSAPGVEPTNIQDMEEAAENFSEHAEEESLEEDIFVDDR